MKYGFTVVLASLALVGCGGGGGGNSAGTTDLPYAPLSSQLLIDEGEEAYRRAVYLSVAQNSTHFLRGDRLVWDAEGQGPTRTTFECDGPRCVESGYGLSDSRGWRPQGTLRMLQRVNSVPRVVDSFFNPASSFSFHNYGGWMEQATFMSYSILLGGEDNPAAGNQYILAWP